MGSIKMAKVRLKAASLIESTIALSIIILVFTLGMMAVNHVLSSNQAAEQYQAGQALRNQAAQCRREESYLPEEIQTGRFLIRKEASAHPWLEGFILLKLEAYNQDGRKIESYYEVVPADP